MNVTELYNRSTTTWLYEMTLQDSAHITASMYAAARLPALPPSTARLTEKKLLTLCSPHRPFDLLHIPSHAARELTPI